MKKILFILSIIFLSPFLLLNVKAMESKPYNVETITQQILTLAFDTSQKNLYKGEKPYVYTFEKLFNLHIQSVAKAYEYLIPNLFKEELDKYLTEVIQNKIISKEFDEWLKLFEIGKFRKKIIEESIKILVTLITQEPTENLYAFIQLYPQTSIIRTITNVFYYQINNSQFLIAGDFFLDCFMETKFEKTLTYSIMFASKFNLPTYLLEQLLEIATYLYYDEYPIEKLYLSSNELVNIPETIECLSNLQEIYLENNHLKSLPESILKLPKLEKIKIDKELLAQLPSEFINSLNTKKIKIELAE
jgi:Leucine-rich repeat (LRR) protein